MLALTERAIRGSFANCSRGEAQRANLPEDLEVLPWEELDFLGWVDAKAPQLAYLVVPRGDRPIGVRLRRNPAAAAGRGCARCAARCTRRTA